MCEASAGAETGGSDVLDLWASASGIGDAVCALYAACGAADTLAALPAAPDGPESGDVVVRLHTGHAGWLERARHPGLEILPCGAEKSGTWVDLARGYDEQLARAQSRKQWYCDNLLPGLTPCAPKFVDTTIHSHRFERTPYVVLTPFSAWPARNWPATHWRYLAALLYDAGFHSVILDGPGDGSRLREAFGALPPEWATWFWGLPEESVTDLMLGAAAVVGPDSGMTHVAALLGVPTVAVMAHLPPGVVFSHTRVRAVTPGTSCAPCRWRPERGYRPVCDAGCSAIATIAPEQVLRALQEVRHAAMAADADEGFQASPRRRTLSVVEQ